MTVEKRTFHTRPTLVAPFMTIDPQTPVFGVKGAVGVPDRLSGVKKPLFEKVCSGTGNGLTISSPASSIRAHRRSLGGDPARVWLHNADLINLEDYGHVV